MSLKNLTAFLLVLNFSLVPIWGLTLNRFEEDLDDIQVEPIDCDLYPENPECGKFERKTCVYSVSLKSKFFPSELAVLCGQPRETLPCAFNHVDDCQLSPMEFSGYELMYLQMLNTELQIRIGRLYRDATESQEFSLETQKEIEAIIGDDLYWLCSRKCSNSTCSFDAELAPQKSSPGMAPSMTTLITDYPDHRHGRQIRILMPIGSSEISRLLQQTTPFKHMAVSSLPLTISCKRH